MKKNIIRQLSFILMSLLLFSCDFEYENAIITENIKSDIYFTNSGFVSINSVISYEEIEHVVTIKRETGVSKKLVLSLGINKLLIDEYNLSVENSYELLQDTYYSIPDSVVFDANSKETSFTIKMKPQSLVTAVGADKANSYILPLEITNVIKGKAEIDPFKCNTMVNLILEKPTVKVHLPPVPETLNFVSGVNISQSYEIVAETNFTTLDVDKIGFETHADWVTTYNQEFGTNYQLLAEDTYGITSKTFKNDTLKLVFHFSCYNLDPSNVYLLPLRITQSADYEVIQHAPVYLIVEISEIKLSILEAEELKNNITFTEEATGEITVKLKSAILENMPIRFIYDGSLVDSYNSANGTSFQVIPSESIEVEETNIAAGTTLAKAGYKLNTAGMSIDPEAEYLVPLTIDDSQLVAGTKIEGSPVIYLKLSKTIEGHYDIEGNEGIHYAGNIKPARDANRGDWMLEAWSGYGFDWASYFIITDEHVDGNPDLLKIQFNDIIGIFYKKDEGDTNRITVDNSYINTKTGEIYFYVEWLNSSGAKETYKGLYKNQQPNN